MPTIARIRLTNVIYENNAKRYNDQLFQFDGENGIFLLENGGGKTVFLQTVLQAIIPNAVVAGRKIKETLVLDNSPAHIAIEWILNEKPRRYAVTAVSLYIENNELKSYKYAYTHGAMDKNSIEAMPFVIKNKDFKERPASRGEIGEYYSRMKQQHMNAETFTTLKHYHKYIEENFKIIPGEWYKIAMINASEGGIEDFFEHCNTTQQLIHNLLIPTVEDALEGSEKIDFVDTFEKQRAHFKQNKKLTEEIEEFRAIKERVDIYLEDYKKLYDAENRYNGVKQEAKRLNKYVLEMLDATEQKRHRLVQEQQNYDTAQNTYLHKRKSLEIAQMDSAMALLDKDKNELTKSQSDIIQQMNDAKMRIQNIEITALETKCQRATQQIKGFEEALQHLNQSEEEQDLKERIEGLCSQIHGLFVDELEGLRKDTHVVEAQQERAIDVLSGIKKRLEEKNTEITKSKNTISGHKSSMNHIHKRMEEIRTKIYEPINDESAEAMLQGFKSESAEIEEALRHLQKSKKEKEVLLESLELEKEKKQALLLETEAQHRAYVTQQGEMDKQQRGLIATLENHFPTLGIFDSVYSKEPTIRETVADRLKKLEGNIEELLIQERMSSRLADMYGDMPHFTADALMAKRMHRLKNQVAYVALGSVYIRESKEALGETIASLYEKYPYWASTLVTTEADRMKVNAYLQAMNHELTYPVIVLTTTQVQRMLKGEGEEVPATSAVFPATWQNNLEEGSFEAWKKTVLTEAQQAKEAREIGYEKLQSISHVKERVETYFKAYPYTAFTQLQADIKMSKEKAQALEEAIEEVVRLKSKNILEKATIENQINERKEQKPIVEKNIELLHDYLNLMKEEVVTAQKSNEAEKQCRQLERAYKRLGDDLHQQESTIEDIRVAHSNLKGEIRRIELHPLFEKVQNTKPRATEQHLDVLNEKLTSAELKLQGISGEAREIEAKINGEKSRRQDLAEQLKRYKKNAKFPIVETKSYDLEALDRLQRKVADFEEEEKTYSVQIKAIQLEKAGVEAVRKKTFEELQPVFKTLIVFEEGLEQVEEALKKEQKNLEKQNTALEERNRDIVAMSSLYGQAKQELAVLAAEHGIGAIALTSYDRNDFINFQYEDRRTMARLKRSLENSQGDFNEKRRFIDEKKKAFLNFCRQTIKAPKLRDTAIKGIERKESYEDLLNYQKNMSDILVKSIKVAEDDRRESDAELQTFLIHLMTYAKNVLNEIEEIQYKTKIKVDDKIKQIFLFTIPKWDEVTAKEALRTYINQLVVAYDKEKAHEDADKESVRKYMEKKLNVKQLILCILGDKRIKVKCRKVTNDLKIGQAPMNWESSNKWSGGEKWSKNMTLFLSILNYLAEKKQYLSVTQKRHRTVILDNPFGKASSKHVLDPVFFVAENLGFQMLTVTAHAEGQFVTDYFPVVYSGKLRGSSEMDKQIMDVTKTLNTAYFKSASPDTLARFEESEQMGFLV